MVRILKNKTASDVTVQYENTGAVVPASGQADLALVFQSWQLANIDSLVLLLAQGTDYFQLNDGTSDLESVAAIDLIRGYSQNINIKSSAITLPSQEKGFQDLTGHNVYRFGHLSYTAKAGKTTIFMEKFSSTMYIQGGGVDIPDVYYVNGAEVENKPEKGDYCCFDLVDVDNVTGYGKTATIANVARASNVATITTGAAHTFAVGDLVCINVNDDTFDDMEVAIISVPDNTHFTYANTGDDVVEKAATGSVGKIVVLAPFVPKDYAFPKMTWECMCGDAKAVPAGIYLRFKYVSLGSTDIWVLPHYKLRT